MVRFCFLAGIAVFVLSSGLLAARDWVKWDHCEYFEGPHSDGDSIEILRGGKRHVFRLYFVDCVEKNPASAARRAEQGLYFGLKPSGDLALRAAYLARNFTRKQLREPFTVYTRWQPVDPEGDNPAVRAFVETASGEDLAKLLVEQGLAIIRHGQSAVSDHPDGRTGEEVSSDLRRSEAEARALKRGAWGLAAKNESGRSEDVLSATETEALVSRAGTRASVRGRVARVVSIGHGRMTFIDFAARSGEGFTGIVRASAFPDFVKRFPGGLKNGLEGRDVLLEGLITLYRGVPQIVLESPSQLRVERTVD